MTRFFTYLGAILVLTGALASAQANSEAPVQRRLRSHPFRPQNTTDFSPDPAPIGTQPAAQPIAPQAVAPAAQAAPIPAAQPPSAESLPPPTSAQVTYRNNLLTVQATNSTLSGLLVAIRNKTGIQFEGLESGATERVAISMGPAPEGEILAAILGGSKFDYVVVERPDSPGTVQRVLLSPRGGASPAVAGAAPAPVATNADGDEEEPTEEAEAPQDTPVRPPISQVQPQPQPQQQQPSQPKTPEQLLEELKRMQQQQQPLQPQQQNAPVKGPPPIPQ